MADIDNPHQKLTSFSVRASSAQRRLIRYLQGNIVSAASLSIDRLAAEAEVSETTVVRLSKAIGYNGFRDFKAALIENRGILRGAQLLGSDIPDEISSDESVLSIAKKVIRTNSEALLETAELLESEPLESVVAAILHARTVTLVGFGSSSPVALDAYQRFLRLAIRASYYSDPHVAAVAAANARKGDLFLCVSYSGESKDIVETLKVARSGGAECIVLTNTPDSTAAGLADQTLVAAFRRKHLPTETVSSRIAQLAVVDVLCVILAVRKADTVIPVTARIERALQLKRLKAPAAGKEVN